MSIDFETNNIILVFYPAGSGGKFLINSLCLADNCYFPFDIEKSYRTIVNQELCYVDLKNLNKISNFYHWNKSYTTLSNSKNKKFIIACYSIQELFFYKSIWINASIIYFENTFKFVSKYRKKYYNESKDLNNSINLIHCAYTIWKKYKIIKGKDWPKFPTNCVDWNSVPTDIIEEIKLIDPDLLQKIKNWLILSDFYKNLKNDSKVFFWNVDSYLSQEAYLKNVNLLYSFLELDNFNRKIIKKYYIEYMNKIEKLSKIKKNDYHLMNKKQLNLYEQKIKNEIEMRLKDKDYKTANFKLNELETILECYLKKFA
jgi:hypothetical protein